MAAAGVRRAAARGGGWSAPWRTRTQRTQGAFEMQRLGCAAAVLVVRDCRFMGESLLDSFRPKCRTYVEQGGLACTNSTLQAAPSSSTPAST